ncbi:response regulator [Caldimonas sp. KR1-144]|uniref:response regulator n=1 Tax=Caldimonas sp. KR1-144 TaxID=3400911 RepID=UPI003C047DD5
MHDFLGADRPCQAASPAISILAVDDHSLILGGIEAVVKAAPDLRFVGGARTAAEAIELYRRHEPDITVVDVNLPDRNGIEVLREIRGLRPDARLIVLTTYRGDVLAVQALKSGACGFLLKSSLEMELIEAIRAVHAGKRYITADIAAEIAAHVDAPHLSEREVAVLKLAAAGSSNKQIARELAISEQTVKGHMSNAFGKLGAADRAHAVAIAVQRGVLYL